MQMLHKTELEVFIALKFEPFQDYFGQASPLPVKHLRKAIKRLRAFWRLNISQSEYVATEALELNYDNHGRQLLCQ
jgi:hypothetical protein